MHKNIPEEIVLRFWLLFMEFANLSILQQRSIALARPTATFSLLNYCSALKLYIEGAHSAVQCNMRAAMKREALDFDVNPIGRIVLILSNLCMVTSRLTALVVFAYRCTAFLTPPPP